MHVGSLLTCRPRVSQVGIDTGKQSPHLTHWVTTTNFKEWSIRPCRFDSSYPKVSDLSWHEQRSCYPALLFRRHIAHPLTVLKTELTPPVVLDLFV